MTNLPYRAGFGQFKDLKPGSKLPEKAKVLDKKTGQLIKKFKRTLETDNESHQVIHDFDVDLHGFIGCYFTKLKTKEMVEKKDA